MLQDLDSLAARLDQLVQFTRQLQTERGTLHARIKSLEQERNALRQQLEHLDAEHKSAASRLEQHDSEVDTIRRQSDATHVQLRAETARIQADYENMKQKLQSCQADVSRLHAATGSARDRVDAILMRLPGSSPDQE